MEQRFFDKSQFAMFGHYPVSVITEKREDAEMILAPFQENNMGTCPKEYLTFISAESEYEKDDSGSYESFYDFVEDHGYTFDEEHKAYGHWENPNAKWDSYKIGGRFKNLIPMRDGFRSCCCRISEINMDERQEKAYEDALLMWDRLFATKGEIDRPIREQFLKCYGGRIRFAGKHSAFATGAVLTPDGNWREIGKRGEVQNDTPIIRFANHYSRFREIMAFHPDYWLTVVDCHI